MRKSKDSLNDCFENVNKRKYIDKYIYIYYVLQIAVYYEFNVEFPITNIPTGVIPALDSSTRDKIIRKCDTFSCNIKNKSKIDDEDRCGDPESFISFFFFSLMR